MRLALLPICLLAGVLHANSAGTYRLKGWVELPEHPRALAYDSKGRRLIATGGREGFGYLVQTDGAAGAAPRDLGHGMESLVSIAAAKSGLFLANRARGLVQHIPLRQADARSRIRVGQYPGALAIAPDETFLCVLSGCDWRPGVYDTGGALRVLPIPLGQGTSRVCPIPEQVYGEPRSLCVSPDGHTAYVATSPTDYGSATILAVNLESAQITAHYTVSEPYIWVSRNSLVLSPTGQPVLAIDGRQNSRLVLFSTELVPQHSLALKRGPTALAVSPDGRRGVVASRGASCLQILDLAKFTLGPPFPSPVECPSVLSFGADSERLFVGSSFVPRLACLEYANVSPPALPPADTAPREERIVYHTRQGNRRMLWAVRPDGMDRRLIARLPVASPQFVRFSPDGRRLVYPWKEEQVWDLFSLDLVTGENRRLTDAKRDRGIQCMGAIDAAFAPHGRAIVYVLEYTMHEKALVVMSSQGGPTYPLVDHYDDLDSSAVPHPWDPDRLLFLYDSGNWTFNREIRLFDRDTDTEWTIRPRDGHTPWLPVWSLDGKHVYWGRSGTEFRSAVNLWTMRPDGTESESLVNPISTPSVNRMPTAVAPDGSQLLWQSAYRDDRYLYIADLKRRTIKPLVATDTYEFPVTWQRIVVPPSPFHVP